ncbi:hypothetical protein ACPXCH_18950 [Streptomyces albogriseolus]|uniref:hypothetical protein n=1 Tax=Streptomyces albogriseolus TaxID=1887 RepID=UPI003CE74679
MSVHGLPRTNARYAPASSTSSMGLASAVSPARLSTEAIRAAIVRVEPWAVA